MFLRVDFYVEDALRGASSLTVAQQLQAQLIELLERGGIAIQRLCSNHPELLKIATSNKEHSFSNRDEDQSIKLGLLRNRIRGCFSFSLSVNESIMFTKRTIICDRG